MPHTTLRLRLVAMNFLQFAVWGAYLTSLGAYLAAHALGHTIGWFYVVQGIISIFMPGLMGLVADRWVPAQRLLGLCHLMGGGLMCAAGAYALHAGTGVAFGPLFTLYALSVLFYMPTLALSNAVAFSALTRAGLDTVRAFPPIRVFGTVGFICTMLVVNWAGFQTTPHQLLLSGALSLALGLYAHTLPPCPVSPRGPGARRLTQALGLDALQLFRQRRMAVFFIFSAALGVSLQITNGYANPFITGFKSIPEYAGTFGANNANALISLSQISETLCILLIPFCLRKFGIKGVMLMSMFAWVFRFGFFGLGDPGSGVWLFVLSCIVYGIAFDFFNVSGGLYVDRETSPDIRSSAQGLFMIMTNGVGATVGTLAAQAVVNSHVYRPGLTPMQQISGWETSWFIFAGYALVVAVLFMIIFKEKKNDMAIPASEVKKAEGIDSPADGFIEE